MQRKIIFILTMIVLPGMLFIGCNKKPDRETPETFDSSIDGIAVQALPNIDLDLANGTDGACRQECQFLVKAD